MPAYPWKRNRARKGDYLMRDDESGLIHYRSEMVKRWDGAFVHFKQQEQRNPQEFVKASRDPRSLHVVRPEPMCAEVSAGARLTTLDIN